MMNKKLILLVMILSIMAITTVSAFVLRDRIAWHVNQLSIRLSYALNPPEEEVFIPNTALPGPTNTSTPIPIPTATSTPAQVIDQATVEPTLTPTPLPDRVQLEGVQYVGQHGLFNYCAPANLAMGLSYWGYEGDRRDVGTYLKPFEKDKNVMLYEMENYVKSQTSLGVITRHGGTQDLLKTLVANGFPVLIEKGAWMRDLTNRISWMGHFGLIIGYDEGKQQFLTKDSYYGPPEYPEVYPVDYATLEREWRGFNYLFMVIYAYHEEARLLDLLGEYSDAEWSYRTALKRAEEEIHNLPDVDQVFAIFNRGTSLVMLQDYAGAANAYDDFFIQNAALPENQRPWRMVWYQTGPYFAYFFSARYQDIINLATKTLNVPEPFLEESWYWRARAYVALGEREKAISDLRQSLEYHPNFGPSVQLMQELGVTN